MDCFVLSLHLQGGDIGVQNQGGVVGVLGAIVVVDVTGVPGAACAKARLAFVVTSMAGAV